jgi:hypothetical protein
LIIALPLVVVAAKTAYDYFASADTSIVPDEVIISNVSDTSATISWVTQAETTGLVNYGSQVDNYTLVGKDTKDSSSAESYKTHYVTIKNLSPNTTYYFEITSGAGTFQNGENPYSFKTLVDTESLSTPDSIIGSISTSITEGIVYAHASNGSSVSTPISVRITSSNFALVKANFKDANTGEVYDLSNADILISVTDKDGNRGHVQVSGSSEKISDTISLAPNGASYNPYEVLIIAGAITPTQSSGGQTVQPTTTDLGTNNTQTLLSTKTSYGAEKSNPTIPYSIFISNISSTGFSINWLTKEPTLGKVLYKRVGQTDKLALDDRDATTNQIKRYTHMVTISESNFTSDEDVAFYIYAGDSPYGTNLGLDYYIFNIPETLSSPPSPESIEGTVALSFASFAHQSNQDLLTSAKKTSSTESSTWVSTVQNTSSSTNWTLPYNTILDTSLGDYFSEDDSEYHIEVHGEYNGFSQKNVDSNDDVVQIELDPGLSITNIFHNSEVEALSQLMGTAEPSSQVSLDINGLQQSIKADSTGRWTIALAATTSGTYSVTSQTSSGDVLGVTFQVNNTNGLPSTDITDLRPIIFGFLLIIIGFLLQKQIKFSRSRLYK